MKLIVWEVGLDGDVSNTLIKQPFEASEDVDLYAIRAHLMIVGSPAGGIYFQIWDETEDRIVMQSDSHTITDLKTLANAHGMYRFVFNKPLKAGSYRMLLRTNGGYSYSSSAFVGWCAHSELRRISLTSGFLGGSVGEPKGIEFWTYKNLIKGVA